MNYILSLDVGATSLGWCILNGTKSSPSGIEAMGVRIFPDGRDAKSQEPLAVTRRDARGARRRQDRLKIRKNNLMQLLVENNLMPADEKSRKEIEKENPYNCRAEALNGKLEDFKLGRALFHICQRRGFKSNRKSDKKSKDSNMKTSIKELNEKIEESGCRTLGEFLFRQENAKRVKTTIVKGKNEYNFYPDRDMYEREFNKIMANQNLPQDLVDKIRYCIFSQRPLQKQKVGKCIFEEKEFRAPKASPLFQKFRYLQTLNNLEFVDPENGECLSDDQWTIIREMLETSKEVNFDSIRKKLKTDHIFNFESERRKKIEGDETAALLGSKKAFGKRWFSFPDEEKEKIVNFLLDEEDEHKVEEFLTPYELSAEEIEYISDIEFPDSYGHLSAKALKRIVPYLEQRLEYSKACEQAGYNHSEFETKEHKELPYYAEILTQEVMGGSLDPKEENIEKRFGKIANPTVHIALNQIRRLVNEVIKQYGKPAEIVVEVARDLKMSKKQKKELEKEQTQNTRDNERINEELEKLGQRKNYNNRMIYKLWEDLSSNTLKRSCPFCGTQTSLGDLFSGEWEIEHLIPFSRSFNDSRSNKVLSCRNCNRTKGNRTPYEAFGKKPEWAEIISRTAELPKNKQWRFAENAMEKVEGENGIIARQLNDTRYLAVAAKKYLGAVCPEIRTIPGQLTALMRESWGFNTLIGDDDTKDRTDHRHHAIDALTIACTTRSTLQKVSTDSEKNWAEKRKLVSDMQEPFPGFNRNILQQLVDNMIISYKSDHKDAKNAVKQGKTTGCLHEDTNYGFIGYADNKKSRGIFATKKPLSGLDEKRIEEIADKAIRDELEYMISQAEDAKKAIAEFADSNKWNAKSVRLHIEKTMDSMIPIKDKRNDNTYRYVASGNNYCAEIYMPNRGKNKDKWCAEIISVFNAHRKDFRPKWKTEEPEAKLIMRLFIDDMVAYDKDGQTKICRVKKLTNPDRIFLRPHNIAKEKADKKSWGAFPEPLRKANARKIKVDALGRVYDPKSQG